jgi:uncharacterized membrane protein YbhN (UPF0104 family)
MIHPEISETSSGSTERSLRLRVGGVRKSLLLIGKVVFSVALLGYLLMKVEWRNIGQAMSVFNPSALLISGGFLVLAIVLSARRWRLFIPSQVDVHRIRSLYFIGAFFNTCLPGIVGGDVIKAYYLSHDLREKREKEVGEPSAGSANGSGLYTINSVSVGSVFMDRFMGLVTLVAVVFAVYPWGFGYLRKTPAEWIVPAFLIAFPLFSLAFFRFRVGRRFLPLERVHNYFSLCAARKDVLVKALSYSIGIQLLVILSAYIISYGLSIEVSFFSFFVFIPLINILLLIPVSISGIGLREGAFVFFFGTLGVPLEKAVALSFLWFLSQVAASLPGLYQYALGYKKLKKDLFSQSMYQKYPCTTSPSQLAPIESKEPGKE